MGNTTTRSIIEVAQETTNKIIDQILVANYIENAKFIYNPITIDPITGRRTTNEPTKKLEMYYLPDERKNVLNGQLELSVSGIIRYLIRQHLWRFIVLKSTIGNNKYYHLSDKQIRYIANNIGRMIFAHIIGDTITQYDAPFSSHLMEQFMRDISTGNCTCNKGDKSNKESSIILDLNSTTEKIREALRMRLGRAIIVRCNSIYYMNEFDKIFNAMFEKTVSDEHEQSVEYLDNLAFGTKQASSPL